MRSALALSLVAAMLAGGCFPHSAKKRVIAEIAEGALLAGGVVLESTVTTTADCEAMLSPSASCGADGTRNGGIGVAMILTGLVAFIATISSAEEAAEAPVVVNSKPAAAPPPTMPAPAPAPAPAPMPAPAPGAPAPTGSASLMSF
jgi:hypothetical protein